MTYTGDPNTQNTGSTRDHSVLEPLPRPNPGKWGDAKQIGDPAILNCQTWLAENYERADIVTELARQSGLPKRAFDRRFRAATGYAPLANLQALRIEEAKQLVETGSATIEAVAREGGHGLVSAAGLEWGARRRPAQVPRTGVREPGGTHAQAPRPNKTASRGHPPNSPCPGRNGARGVVRPRAAPLGARAVRRLGQSDYRPTGPHRRPKLRPHGEVRHFAFDGYSPKYFKAI